MITVTHISMRNTIFSMWSLPWLITSEPSVKLVYAPLMAGGLLVDPVVCRVDSCCTTRQGLFFVMTEVQRKFDARRDQ